MANLRDIRRRIRSVKNTSQITHAMQMVAASKMKRAQAQALAGRTYEEHINAVLSHLAGSEADVSHPLMESHGTGPEMIVLITTDKGLCGGLNTNLLKKVFAETEENARFVTVGKRGRTTMAKLKRDIAADFPVHDPVHFSEVKQVARFVAKAFLDGEVSRVRVAFNNFVNTLSQVPHLSQLLPIDPAKVGQDTEYKTDFAAQTGSSEIENKPPEDGFADYLFEPDRATFYASLLPLYGNHLVYQMILEARASEHSARMVAMKNATENAKDIIKDLTLESNKLRQEAITNELLEISTAQMALG